MLRLSVGATARLCGRSVSGSSESPASSFARCGGGASRNNSFVASRRVAAASASGLRSKNPLAGASTPARSILRSLERNSSAAAAAKPAAKGVPFSELSVGVPKEIFENEKRVALSPAAAATLIKNGFSVNVEKGAGFEAKFLDADYVAAGCNVVDSASAAFGSDIVLKVRPPSMEEVPLVKDGGHLISFVYPAQNKELLDALAEKKATVLGMECVPRISRAQVRDACIDYFDDFGHSFDVCYKCRNVKCRSLPIESYPLSFCLSFIANLSTCISALLFVGFLCLSIKYVFVSLYDRFLLQWI